MPEIVSRLPTPGPGLPTLRLKLPTLRVRLPTLWARLVTFAPFGSRPSPGPGREGLPRLVVRPIPGAPLHQQPEVPQPGDIVKFYG